MTDETGWQRVFGFLPVNDAEEIEAASVVIKWLEELFPGLTASRLTDSPFEGYYRLSDGSWCLDRIGLVFVDSRFEQRGLSQFTERFGKRILQSYIDSGRPQETVLVSAHALTVANLFSLPTP